VLESVPMTEFELVIGVVKVAGSTVVVCFTMTVVTVSELLALGSVALVSDEGAFEMEFEVWPFVKKLDPFPFRLDLCETELEESVEDKSTGVEEGA